MAYLRAKGAPEIEAMPEPEDWFLWQAFHHLRGSRGMGSAIPFSEIAAYADWCGIECPIQRDRLVRAIVALDNAEGEHGRTAPRA